MNYLNDRLVHKTTRFKTIRNRRPGGRDRFVKDETVAGVYYSYNPFKNEYMYSLETFSYLKRIIITLGYKIEDILNIKEDKEYNIEPFNKEISFSMDSREYQEQYINRVLRMDKPTYLVHLQMGMGKTAIATKLMEVLNYRTAIIGAPAFVKKWYEDLRTGYFKSKEEEIFLIQGTSSINKLFKELEKGRDIRFLLISTSTFKKFIQKYNDTPSELWDMSVIPTEFGRKLGIGLVINDEVHDFYNANFLTTIAIDAKVTVGLTATLVTTDKKLAVMHTLLYPKESVFEFLEYKKLINAIGVRYKVNYKYNINVTQNGANYSQAVLEGRILNHKELKDFIFEMLATYLDKGFINRKDNGDKAIFYFSTVRFCSKFKFYLKERLKGKGLKIERYTQEDPYRNLMESDVIISTYKSAGTGEDIKGLTTIFNFDVFKSIVMNLQLPGRLREIKGKELRYYYFYNIYNMRHIDYIRERERIIRKMSKEITTEYYSKSL